VQEKGDETVRLFPLSMGPWLTQVSAN